MDHHLGKQVSAALTSGGATEERLGRKLEPNDKLVADNHPIQVQAHQDGDLHLRTSLLKVLPYIAFGRNSEEVQVEIDLEVQASALPCSPMGQGLPSQMR